MTIHGGDIYTFEKETGMKPLDFSENTNPMGLPKAVGEAIANSIELFSSYPDLNCSKLTNTVAKFYGVLPKKILFGNGAADIIFKIAYALKPEKALVLAPSFAEYEIALKKAGTKTQHYILKEESEFEIEEDILNSCENKTVFICNPNNPTGKLCKKDLLLKIAEKADFLIVDECFMDFVSENEKYTLLKDFENFDNIIILKAFTKIFAMAGLRLGFCICNDENLLEKINSFGQPWSVSTVAQVAGIACCSEFDYVKKSLELVLNEREFLENQLAKLGFKVYKSHANYIFFKAKSGLVEQLKKDGIMIRSCENYCSLNENYYRIAVKKHCENLRLLTVLGKKLCIK